MLDNVLVCSRVSLILVVPNQHKALSVLFTFSRHTCTQLPCSLCTHVYTSYDKLHNWVCIVELCLLHDENGLLSNYEKEEGTSIFLCFGCILQKGCIWCICMLHQLQNEYDFWFMNLTQETFQTLQVFVCLYKTTSGYYKKHDTFIQ